MVVLQADRLRIEAADVLLKVLEEPPGDTVFMLLTARTDELPETIRSRCQDIAFPPLRRTSSSTRWSARASERLRHAPGGAAVGREPRPGPSADARWGPAVPGRGAGGGDRARGGAGEALGAAEDLRGRGEEGP